MHPRRPLRRYERALLYGALGWAVEVGFTGIQGVLHAHSRHWRLQGHTYLWMLPIYGLAAFIFEPVHDALRSQPLWRRGVAYAAGFTTVELTTGTAIRSAVGVVPWDYTGRSRFAIRGGVVRLDYLPLWALAGLAFERIDDTIRDVPVIGTRRG